jgi:Cu+-exporting ATPase
MALELKTISADSAEDNPELIDMTRRFWIGAALTLRCFSWHVSSRPPPARWFSNDVSRWIQFVLTTPVVLWAGWLFSNAPGARFTLNMFTSSR